MNDDSGEVTIKTREGWYIISNLTYDIETQFQELIFALDNKIDKDKINYVDLRFFGKIYWQ